MKPEPAAPPLNIAALAHIIYDGQFPPHYEDDNSEDPEYGLSDDVERDE